MLPLQWWLFVGSPSSWSGFLSGGWRVGLYRLTNQKVIRAESQAAKSTCLHWVRHRVGSPCTLDLQYKGLRENSVLLTACESFRNPKIGTQCCQHQKMQPHKESCCPFQHVSREMPRFFVCPSQLSQGSGRSLFHLKKFFKTLVLLFFLSSFKIFFIENHLMSVAWALAWI